MKYFGVSCLTSIPNTSILSMYPEGWGPEVGVDDWPGLDLPEASLCNRVRIRTHKPLTVRPPPNTPPPVFFFLRLQWFESVLVVDSGVKTNQSLGRTFLKRSRVKGNRLVSKAEPHRQAAVEH